MPTTDGVGLPADYVPMGSLALTDGERWPTLPESDLRRVADARAHPAAPHWQHETGDRLEPADLAALASRAPVSASAGPSPPDWVAALVERAHRTVPRYRAAARDGRSGPTTPLRDLPTVTRRDLVTGLAAHVPLDVPLDRVLQGTSSGSTGAALRVPLHPRTVAADLLLLHALVTGAGTSWPADPARLGLVNLVDQRAAFTYVSAMSAFPRPVGSPAPLMARVNLDVGAWRTAADRERWFAEHDPQVVSTSSVPLVHLLDLAEAGLAVRPVAVVNGATHVTPAVRRRVRDLWAAPLVDLYGLRETGPVAAACDAGREHALVARRVHVEVLDPAGRPLPAGRRGEVVVTVDENPYLPLLRYRTGDHAALGTDDAGRPVLLDLEGRAAVRFLDATGAARPSVDATQVLQAAGLTAWHLHQDADGDVRLSAVGDAAAAAAAVRAVREWLGRPVGLELLGDVGALGQGKPARYSSALDLP
ncbi:AMP-binding protein [Cellulomonas wangsupingiae]|uniref:AMP-binding protein n=1 Tax=Cellulomonas wangsupingiae TaxID=2968085 RepID=UPI001D0E8DAF|nr:AMP-binding protein [Cellulomonas wangsupingiae]MCM0639034.1 AMP-binding protein [Cellulomonas wangsupingiae]